MKFSLLVAPLLAVCLQAHAQQSVPASWDVTKSVTELAAQVAQLKPLLENLTPQTWVEKGGPEAYVAQWNGAREELGYLAQAAQSLEKQPEKLTAALDVYFRLQGI